MAGLLQIKVYEKQQQVYREHFDGPVAARRQGAI